MFSRSTPSEQPTMAAAPPAAQDVGALLAAEIAVEL